MTNVSLSVGAGLLCALLSARGIAVGVGLLLVLSHLIERIPGQRGVLLGIAAGLGFGISDVAIKALSGDLEVGPAGVLSPWSVVIVTAAVFSFCSRSPRKPTYRRPHHSLIVGVRP